MRWLLLAAAAALLVLWLRRPTKPPRLRVSPVRKVTWPSRYDWSDEDDWLLPADPYLDDLYRSAGYVRWSRS